MKPLAVLSINAAWNVANFRGGLVRALQGAGWNVAAMAPPDPHVVRVEALGCRFVPVEMTPGGTNPLQDWRLYRRYLTLLRALRPQVYLGFTIKPNVWGAMAAQRLGIPVINNIAGLGSAFIRKGWLNRVARTLYRRSLAGSYHVLFQNEEDRRLFVESGMVAAERTGRVPGSGVDLEHFAASPLPSEEDGLRVLMVARLLRDKGLFEFAEAGRLLHEARLPLRLQLLGAPDPNNPSSVSMTQVRDWQARGWVEYLGQCDDVRPHLRQAHAVALPSYREGVPRTLLEAAATGRPLIATNAVGCREPVREGVNGLLVPPHDAVALALGLQHFAGLSPSTRAHWGAASRRLVERVFDERLVTDAYLRLLAPLT